METKARAEFDFGGSLPVANVQALAAESLADIPSRYLHLSDELGQVWSTGSPLIPDIDTSKLSDGDMGSDTEMEKLHTASKEWDFFQLQTSNRVSGLTPHSDTRGITLLLQTSDVDGLQIKKNGKWLPIKPVPGTLIINIGDVIKIMSNGEYKSTAHRAMVNPEKERLSIAAFHSIKLEGTVEPLPDFVKKSGTLYKILSNIDYIRLLSGRKLDGKRKLDFMKLNNE